MAKEEVLQEVAVKPDISTIKRTVGVEIECMVPSDYSRDDIEINGVDVDSDGSIDGDGEGIEVKTPLLSGEAAEERIQHTATKLAEYGAFTNSSCGLHVHVDASEVAVGKTVRWTQDKGDVQDGETLIYMHKTAFEANGLRMSYNDNDNFFEVVEALETAKMLDAIGAMGEGKVLETYGVRRYARSRVDGSYVIPEERHGEYYVFSVNIESALRIKRRLYHAMRFFAAVDPVLRGLVPSSRRHNTYCQPFEKIARSGGACPDTLRDLMNGITQRYCGINLHALLAHGTIECRYHDGTVNGDKIVHWARLWERVVDLALSDNAEGEADALCEVVNCKNRLDMLLALLDLPTSTETYLKERHTAFMGSDARHAIAYINSKTKKRVCVA